MPACAGALGAPLQDRLTTQLLRTSRRWPLTLSLTLLALSRPKTFLHGQAAAVGIAIFNGVGEPFDSGHQLHISSLLLPYIEEGNF